MNTKSSYFPIEKTGGTMYWNPDMDVEEYLEYCIENRIFPRYKGLGPFQELLKRGRITPFITMVRVMYTGLIDQCYCLDDNGMFLLINNPDEPPQKTRRSSSGRQAS